MKSEDIQNQYEKFKEILETVDFDDLKDTKELIFRLINVNLVDNEKLEALFKSQKGPTCKKVSLPIMYVCLDCFYDDVILCTDCFDEQNHKNHQFQVLQNSSSLQCGCGNLRKMKYEAMCKQHQTNPQEIVLDDIQNKFIQNVKIILEIAAYDALRQLELAALQLLYSDNGQKNAATYLKKISIMKITEDAQISLSLFTRIASYLSKFQQFQQVVIDILLSQIPQELQELEIFKHSHQIENFEFYTVIKKDGQEICTCSVWKIYLNTSYIQVLMNYYNQKALYKIVRDIKMDNLLGHISRCCPFNFNIIQNQWQDHNKQDKDFFSLIRQQMNIRIFNNLLRSPNQIFVTHKGYK